MRVCLDTSAYSHFKRGDPDVVEAVTEASWVGIPAIVLGELRAGFLQGARADANERELRRFLGRSVVSVLDIDEAASRHYADIVLSLRRRGTPIPTNDIWIASVAARDAATVLTFDRHFAGIERVAARVFSTANG